MDRKRAETLWNLGDSLSVLNLSGAEVADLCAAWVELHKDKRLPAYPCPINEANEKIRELKEDAAKMMDELARLRAENERLTEALTHYQHPDTVAEISLRGKMPAFPIQLYCSACGSLVATCGEHADGGVSCHHCGASVSIIVDCVGKTRTTVWPCSNTLDRKEG